MKFLAYALACAVAAPLLALAVLFAAFMAIILYLGEMLSLVVERP